MTVKELQEELTRIVKVHPECEGARVIGLGDHTAPVYIAFVRYDTKHKPPRLILED